MRERTLAFFQDNKDPIGEYFLLVRDLYLDMFRDTKRAKRNIEMTLDILADCYLNKMTLEEAARARNITRERVRMMTERAVGYVRRRCMIDLRELLRLVQETEKASDEV